MLAEHPLWNGESARRNHPASGSEPIRDGAASIAAPQVPAAASVGSTEAAEKDFCGSIRFCTFVTLDPERLHASDNYIYITC
jgi:hypothetical protein